MLLSIALVTTLTVLDTLWQMRSESLKVCTQRQLWSPPESASELTEPAVSRPRLRDPDTLLRKQMSIRALAN